jgi:hypothetical protein
VRYERLVIQAGSTSFTLELHPRLTVIAGLGQLERESLIGELVGAFGAARSGVHAEIVQDDGRHIALFRPEGGRHRIIDVGSATDVSSEYADAAGRLDLLVRDGLDVRSARAKMRFAAGDLTSRTQGAEQTRRLADCHQDQLWEAAEAVQKSDDDLQRTAEALGSSAEDADVVDRIEQEHRKLEIAEARHESFRRKSLVVAVAATVLAIPTLLVKPSVVFPFLALASISVLVSMLFRARVGRATRAVDAALAEVGAQTYLGFQIQRVDGLLSSEQHRRQLSGSAGSHREAVARWHALVGDVPVEWALERKEEIIASARLRRDVTTMGLMSSTAPELDDEQTTDLAHGLVARLAELRHLGARGESFPLVLDDPFRELSATMKPALLELLGHAAGSPQLIFLTEDEDVASWARLEALTGALSIVEPQPEPAHRTPRLRRVTA